MRASFDANIGSTQPGEAARIVEVAIEPKAPGSTSKKMWRTRHDEDEN